MNFKENLRNGKIRKVNQDGIRASNLFKSSRQAINTAKKIPLSEESSKTILREVYEGLREYCEAIGYLKGYKFLDHESISFFLREELNEEILSRKFDRYRKLRNGINYYGNVLDIETAKECIEEIPKIIAKLGKYVD